jgi:protein-disulfide isomerase
MSELSADGLLGRQLLGEYRLDRLVRVDDALALFEATSTVDGGSYAALVALQLSVETSSTALESAADRAGRFAVGLRGVTPLFHARSESLDGQPRLVVVRRGVAGEGFSSLVTERPRTASEVARLLDPLAVALAVLHDQGSVHGAVCPTTLTVRGDLTLDFFGLSSVAEVASGARGARDVMPAAYRAPELTAAHPSIPGPWSDVFSLALLALELLSGQSGIGGRAAGPVTPRSLGLAVSHRMQDLFERALASAPARRPLDARAFLQEMLAAASDPVVPLVPPASPSGPVDRPSRERLAPFNPPVSEAVRFGTVGPAAPPPSGPVLTPLPPPVAPGPPRLAAPRRLVEESEPWLGFLVGLGVLVLLAGMGGSVLFVLFRAKNPPPPVIVSTSPPSSGPVAVPTMAPSVASGAPPGPARTALVPPATGKPATFPADLAALVPVEADSAVWGDRDALVTMTIFGDLTCPFTARQLDQLPALSARFGDQLRVVFKHYPNPASEEAELASEAAAAALARGKAETFWRFLDGATRGDHLAPGALEDLGVKSGLAAGVITAALTSHDQKAAVERDIDLGRRLGVRGTPVLFLNGRRYNGYQPPEQLSLHLASEIKKATSELSRGTQAEQLYAVRVTRNVTTADGEK